jgi:anti-sigma B factor antagonist
MEHDMQIQFDTQHDVGVAVVTGQVDASSASALADALTARINDGTTQIVADLSKLEFTSSAGLRALLAAVKLSRAHGGDFRIAAAQDRVGRVLEMSGFNSIIRSYATVDDAVASFAA